MTYSDLPNPPHDRGDRMSTYRAPGGSGTITRRVARKRHECRNGVIEPGQVYLLWTDFPGSDTNEGPAPRRLAECADCAKRYGRAHMLQAQP